MLTVLGVLTVPVLTVPVLTVPVLTVPVLTVPVLTVLNRIGRILAQSSVIHPPSSILRHA